MTPCLVLLVCESVMCWSMGALYSAYGDTVNKYSWFLNTLQSNLKCSVVTFTHTHAHKRDLPSGLPQPCFWWDNLSVVLQPMWGRDYIFIRGVFILPLPSVTSGVAMGHLQQLYSGVLGWERVWETERGSDDSHLRNKRIPGLSTPSKNPTWPPFPCSVSGGLSFCLVPRWVRANSALMS